MESQQQQDDEDVATPTYTMSEEDKAKSRYFVYGFIAISSVVIVLSLVLILGLLIPLRIQLKNGTFHQNTTGGRRRRQREPPYSTYNLYLVYLALIDLIYFGLTIAADIMAVTQKYNPRFYSASINFFMDDPPMFVRGDGAPTAIGYYLGPAYTLANMWINAIIAYEVLILLKATHRAQRIDQPSLTRVNLQAGGVIFGSMLFGVFGYYSWMYGGKWSDLWMIFGAMVTAGPFVYVIGVSIFVKWRGYLPAVNMNGSTPRDRAVRGLALYFLRIAFVFIVIWLPSVPLYFIAASSVANEESYKDYITKVDEGGAFASWIGLAWVFVSLLANIQPIITFCMVLPKDDVKKYIKDLVTLKYIFGDCSWNCCGFNNKELPVGANENTNDDETAPTPAKSVTILGYNIPDANDNTDADVDDDDADAGCVDDVEAGAYTSGSGDADPGFAPPMVDYDDDDDDDDDGDTGDDTNVEKGTRKDKSRMLRGGAVTVLATGETVPVESQTAATTSPNRE